MNVLRNTLLSAGLALATAGVPACDADEGQGNDCSLESFPSVSLRVVDEDGERVVLPIGSVTYTVNGGEVQTLEAEFDTLENPVHIYSWSGTFEITVTPEGYDAGVFTTDVGETEDGCHVVTEEGELVLTSAGG